MKLRKNKQIKRFSYLLGDQHNTIVYISIRIQIRSKRTHFRMSEKKVKNMCKTPCFQYFFHSLQIPRISQKCIKISFVVVV